MIKQNYRYRYMSQSNNHKVVDHVDELVEVVTMYIQLVALTMIEYKGWTTKGEILDNVSNRFSVSRQFIRRQYKLCFDDLLDGYLLEVIPSNKKVKEEMGITEDYMSKFSFPNIIRPNFLEALIFTEDVFNNEDMTVSI